MTSDAMTNDAKTNGCAKWKDPLLEAAVTETASSALEAHLSLCARCTQQLAVLRAKQERLDALLPLVAQGAEPSEEFRARVLSATEAASAQRRARLWPTWSLTGGTAVIAAVLVIGWALYRKAGPAVPEAELAAAEKLTEWRAPSDVLLEATGTDILRTTPKLGESYLPMIPKTSAKTPANMNEEN